MTTPSSSLIAALLVPPKPTGLVARPRLVTLLERQLRSPIVLLSGEAGAGKTSLAVQWMNSIGDSRGHVAWLTLRRNLDDPVLFWRYLLAALAPLGASTDELARSLADDEPPNELWLTELANRLAALPSRSTVVLDDFHELASAEALASFEAFLEMVPGPPHFVILTRSKPPWPLARWQMSGRMSEIDSVDLRLTIDEAHAMVDMTCTEIDDVVFRQLLERTEGWAGGIRLALISMRHASDPAEFIARFAADDELVSAYLFREVLEEVDPELRSFLLDCSVLDPLTPEICDALRQRSDSTAFLERCAEENLFVSRLHGSAGTYQLHRLFAEFLIATLDLEAPERSAGLHRCASAMFESKADIQSAIRHAVEGGDQGRVGFLVVKHGMAHATRGEFEALRSWLPLLRGARAGGGPEVTLALANALIVLGQVTEALDLLADIDELDQPSVAYAALQLRALSMLKDGQLDTLRTIANELRAKLSGETPAFGSDALPFEAHGYSGLISGIAALVEGELGTARASLEPALDRHDSNLLSEEVPAWLARTAVAEGKLDLASRHAQESIDRHENRGGGETVVVVPAYVAQADVAWERNELESAERLLEMARRHVRPVWWEMVFVQLSASRLLASRGAVDEAREQLIACGRTYLTGESSTVLRSMLCEALIDLALRTDDLNDAQRWVAVRSVWDSRQLGLPLRLRLAVARGEKTQFEHLDELVATEPLPHAIDAHLAGATLAARSGDHRQCQYFLAGAVRRAERERMIRRIIDYSGEVRVAIRELGEDPPIDPAIPLASPFFVASIVTALDADVGRRPRPATQSDELVEQLTGRELEVLECLSTSRTYREIGSRLYISRNTIKSHVRHIYTKLGVINRDAAVQEGRRLGLL